MNENCQNTSIAHDTSKSKPKREDERLISYTLIDVEVEIL